MGMTCAAVFIHNNRRTDVSGILENFKVKMDLRGYIPVGEDEAGMTFSFVFPKEDRLSEWFALIEAGFADDTGLLRTEAARAAEVFETGTVSVYLCDSDFAELDLYDAAGKLRDTEFAGTPYFDEVPPGNLTKWREFLKDGKTFDDLQRALETDSAFAEDSLAAFGEVLGMDMKLLYPAEEDENVYTYLLHFRRKAGKKLTFPAAFKKIFGPALEPLGFVRPKGMNNIYARLSGGEILELIMFSDEAPDGTDRKCYSINIGVFSVYSPCLDLKKYQRFIANGTKGLCEVYRRSVTDEQYDKAVWNRLHRQSYTKDDETSVLSELKYSLECVKLYSLPELEKINDLRALAEYRRRYNCSEFVSMEKDWLQNREKPNSFFIAEDMLYVLVGDPDKKLKRMMTRDEFETVGERLRTQGKPYDKRTYEQYYSDGLKWSGGTGNRLDELLADPELHKKALEECVFRKEQNLVFLAELGIGTKE